MRRTTTIFSTFDTSSTTVDAFAAAGGFTCACIKCLKSYVIDSYGMGQKSSLNKAKYRSRRAHAGCIRKAGTQSAGVVSMALFLSLNTGVDAVLAIMMGFHG